MFKIIIFFTFLPFIVFACDATEKEKLKLCSTADWPPYESMDPATKQVTGKSVDIIRKMADKLNFDLDVSSLPWERCLQMNQQGDMDGIFSVSKTPDREQFLIYPQEHIQDVSYVFITIKGSKVAWDASKDLKTIPQPIGTPHGYSVTQILKKTSDLKVDDSAQSDEVNLNKLIHNRLGSVVIGSDALALLLKEKNISSQVQELTPPYVDAKKYYIAVSKKYKNDEQKAIELTQKIDVALRDILKK